MPTNRTSNMDVKYKMRNIVLSIKVKNLRVAINADRKVSEEFRIAVLNNNNIIGLIKKNIERKMSHYIPV